MDAELVKNNLFTEDTYDTPPGRRALHNKLLLGCRADFYWRNFSVFKQTGDCARRGELDGEKQVHYSNMNVRITEECGGKFHLRGLDHLRQLRHQPAVIIGNHMSLLETAVLHAIVRPHLDFTFVIKKSLFDIPYFGDIMRALDAIAVSRTNPREDFKQVMAKGKEILGSGRSIILFPQATRSVQFKPEEFNTIGVKLAKSAGVPVIPMALKTDFVSTGHIIRDLGPLKPKEEIHFEFAPPIFISGNGKEEHAAIISFIQSRLGDWQKG